MCTVTAKLIYKSWTDKEVTDLSIAVSAAALPADLDNSDAITYVDLRNGSAMGHRLVIIHKLGFHRVLHSNNLEVPVALTLDDYLDPGFALQHMPVALRGWLNDSEFRVWWTSLMEAAAEPLARQGAKFLPLIGMECEAPEGAFSITTARQIL
jgi:hypothetical protein